MPTARRRPAVAPLCWLGALAAGTAGPIAAQPAEAPDLQRVVVTATRAPLAGSLGQPASVSVVEEDELALRPIARFGDALADVPGVYVRGSALGTPFPATGQAALSLRGIPRTGRTLVMIDGQPLNNALAGGINVSAIPTEGIERVEIVRGPYSALYGGNAMGGVIHFITAGPDRPITELRLGAGNLGQRGASFVHRKRHENGLGVTLTLGWRESSGNADAEYVVRPVPRSTPAGPVLTGGMPTTTTAGAPAWWVGTKGARPWWQGHGQLALHYAPTPATRLQAGVGWAAYETGHSPPVSFLRDAAGQPAMSGIVAAGAARPVSVSPTDFLNTSPSGEEDRRFFVLAEHRLDGGGQLQARLSTLRQTFDYAQAGTGATYDGGPGDFVDQPNRRDSLEVSLRQPVTAGWTLTGGLSLEHSALDRRTHALAQWRDRDSRTGVVGEGLGRIDNSALFVQSEHEIGDRLTVYAGGRHDRFTTSGRVSAAGFDQHYPERSFEQFSPKLAVVWQAQPWLSLRTSYGEAFRAPALLDMYARIVIPTPGLATINDPAPLLGPERVRALELGADADLGRGRRASVTLYAQRLHDLIYRRTLAPAGGVVPMVTENVAAADVNGLEASLRWPTPVHGLRSFAALTHQMRRHIRRNDASPASVGKVLTDVPRTIASAGLELERGPWSGFLAVRHVGHAFGSGDDTNTDAAQGVYGAYDRHTIVSARAAWRFDAHLGASLAVDNLTDRRYFALYRQPGRSVYAEVAYRF